MKKKRGLFFLLAVILLGGFLASRYLMGTEGNNLNVLKVSGNIEIDEVMMSFKIPGRIVERPVKEGDQVHAGQLVARIDDKELTQEVALSRAEVGAASAALAELDAGSRPEEIGKARAVLQRNKAELNQAQSEYNRQKDLYESHVISKNAFEVAETLLETAKTKVKEAEEQLALVIKGPREEQILQAQARLEKAQAALGLAETRLGNASLFSPLNGVILAEDIQPGEYAVPGTPVVTGGNLEEVWLRAYINETDLGRIKLGQVVGVRTDTFPDKVYKGRITFIASEAEFTPKSVQTQKERVKLVYRIKVVIPNPDMELKPGMPADAEIGLTQNGSDKDN